MSDRVFLIGAGRVGRGLALAFERAARERGTGTEERVRVVGVHARTPREGATSAGAYPATLAEANVVVIAVRDAEVNGVAASLLPARLPRDGRLSRGAIVLQTSGTAVPAAFGELRAGGLACGTFHPLAPFATPERGAAQLRDGWIGIDGDAAAMAGARRLAAAVGARTVNIPRDAGAAYHAAAVMAANFPVVLAALATRTLVRAGVDGRTAEQVVQRLLAGAAENLAHGSPAAMLTGPAVRGDTATIQAHRDALRGDPVAAAAYDALSRAAAELAADHRLLVDDAHPGRRGEAEGVARDRDIGPE